MNANLPLPFKKPLGAAGRGLPAATLASGDNSSRLVPDSDADSGYFRALESRGLFLNGPQIEAVRHGDGPLLTLAGAGSGKTSVLAARTGYLIAERGADPRAILLVTFSVKAAQEMKDRIAALPGIAHAAAKAVTARTFHSFFLQLLRSQGFRQEILGGGPLAVIVLKGMLRELGIADRLEPETALAALSEAKLSLRPLAELPESSQAERDLKRLLLRFEEWKEREGRMDFDDILLWSHRLLTERPALLRTLQDRFRLIMIDEFQDTSRLQYELIRLLAGKRANLMAVGDDDQTIYGFSGARSEYILGFRDAFPGARVVTLDTNYRSSASIVGLGNDIIRHNKARYAKTLKAVRTSRQVPLYIRPFTTDQEAAAVAAHIRERVEEGARGWGDFAILYRTASNSRAMFEQLVLSDIPFHLQDSGEPFYDQSAVRPLVDYLRLSVKRRDFAAMEGVLPSMYVGRAKGMAHIRAKDDPRPKKGPLIHLLTLDGLKDFQRDSIQARITFIKGLKALKPADAIRRMRKDFYDAWLDAEAAAGAGSAGTVYKETLREALDELEASAGRFADVPSFLAFVKRIGERHAEMRALPPEAARDAVKLMTIHKSKGLEFPAVVLIGASEGILPHSLALEADKLSDYGNGAAAAGDPASLREAALEEERRLAYVAVTRARDELLVSSPSLWRGRKTDVSRFLLDAFRPAAGTPAGSAGSGAAGGMAGMAGGPGSVSTGSAVSKAGAAGGMAGGASTGSAVSKADAARGMAGGTSTGSAVSKAAGAARGMAGIAGRASAGSAVSKAAGADGARRTGAGPAASAARAGVRRAASGRSGSADSAQPGAASRTGSLKSAASKSASMGARPKP
ncbi:ATP-dependent helicase [Paenibacillus albicereus]|uniref:DNA 3'-5' helicase n=1 Tax=Paenibacillus albicereus TaxID=2726185 RepID=A0A6H2GTR1_9BACL|nr:ATP-dependent helicase [Paenibacillus albicereus]QJC50556.1 ATP-dependent helicase [Paenibacillus albicereus]